MTTVIDLIPTRLAACCAEISGVTRAFELMPTKPIIDDDLPATYCLPGPLLEAVATSRLQYSDTRTWYLYLLVRPAEQGVDEANLGAEGLQATAPFLDSFAQYFMGHPELQTSTLGALSFCRGFTYRDGGPARINGPGGGTYIGVVFQLDIEMAASITQAGTF